MHHLCLEVDDIDGALMELKGKGVNLIHEVPVVKEDGRKYAFIHPKAATGVLVELYELPGELDRIFPVLETARLSLREFQSSDAGDIFETYARPDLVQWLEHEPMTSIGEAEDRVSSRIRLFERGWGCRWAITLKGNPEKVIGSCGYFGVRIGTHTVEMGFEIHPEFWRQGIMSEAMTTVLDYCFSDDGILPVNRIEALVDPGNAASSGLLTKFGFTDEGTRRSFGFWKGAYQDVKLFALLKEDWTG